MAGDMTNEGARRCSAERQVTEALPTDQAIKANDSSGRRLVRELLAGTIAAIKYLPLNLPLNLECAE